MCGIAGSINFRLDIPALTKDLFHRGPDEQAMFEERNLQFYHFRLAIVDIKSGHQPMEHNDLVIIFNGEIYNHMEVRKKFNLNCKTGSDTETILHAYELLGPKCLDEFGGMFVLAIYDRKRNEIFLARDRAGKKPLYYYEDNDQVVFASELNALRGQLPLQVDEANISQYIYSAYFSTPSTPYLKVKELSAGSYAIVPLQQPQVRPIRWWNIHKFYRQPSNDSFETALEKTDEMLHRAVKRRVESSDLEVGSFLSGGIDSGLVTAIAKKYNSNLKTFTVSFEGEYDEAPVAKKVAEHCGTMHHEIKISFDHLLGDIEKIIYNYGEPIFDSSAIPSYYVSREARKHLTVILNGDGGDELFGGYRRYVPFCKYDFFKPGIFVRSMANVVHPFMPLSHDKSNKYNYIYRLVDFARRGGVNTYLSSTLDVFTGEEQWLKGDKKKALQTLIRDFDRINNSPLTGLQKMLNLDFDHLLANLLVKMDIATMAHSLEGRSPFMGMELLEYIPTLRDEYKVKDTTTKYILRKLAERYLPHEMINLPKRGFEIPLRKWVDNELKEIIGAYLLSPNAYSRNFVDPVFIEKLWNRKVKTGDEKRAKMLYTLFSLEVWYKKCYLRNA